MKIDAQQVKQLRDKTGAGILACREALARAEGDLEKAIDVLRVEGQAQAAKREGREAKEGLLRLKVDPGGQKALLLEVNCETDFVARTPEFVEVVDWLLGEVSAGGSEILKAENIIQRVKEFSGKTGERITPRRALVWERDGFIGGYLHHNGRLAVLVELSRAAPEVARELAMQIAAANPPYLSEADIPPEEKERELEIFRCQIADKPEVIQEKILNGKWRKRLTELCLLQLPYLRDDKISVGGYLKKQAETHGEPIEIKDYVLWRLGEE